MKKAFVVAFSLVGTLVGVGFVSGREIYSFFARFGVFGLISAAISSVIFGLTVFMFLAKSQATQVSDINVNGGDTGGGENCLKCGAVAGRRGFDSNAKGLKFIKIKGIINIVLSELCSLVVMAAMIAGVFDLSANFLGGSVAFSCACICLALVFVVMGKSALDKINRVFIPLVVGFVFINLVFCLTKEPISMAKINATNRGFSAVGFGLMYVGMNVLTVMPIAAIFAGDLKSIKQRRAAAVIFGAIVLVLIFVIGLCLMVYGDGQSSMPLLKLAQTNAGWLGLCFKIIISFGLLTTLIASGVVIKNRIKTKFENDLTSTLLAFILAMVLSLMGFVKIIDVVYPIIGVLGIGYIIGEFIEFFIVKKRKIDIKNQK